jgi:hypothetical protein
MHSKTQPTGPSAAQRGTIHARHRRVQRGTHLQFHRAHDRRNVHAAAPVLPTAGGQLGRQSLVLEHDGAVLPAALHHIHHVVLHAAKLVERDAVVRLQVAGEEDQLLQLRQPHLGLVHL